jgi:hypothetical protein
MRLFVLRPGFSRHPLRSMLVGVGVLAGLALATVGAVLGLALLAAGAIVHVAYSALRGPTRAAPAAPRPSDPNVIEGEFTVVDDPRAAPTRPQRLSRAS